MASERARNRPGRLLGNSPVETLERTPLKNTVTLSEVKSASVKFQEILSQYSVYTAKNQACFQENKILLWEVKRFVFWE